MCWIFFIISFILLCQCCRITAKSQLDDPDENRNVSELITGKGYPVEEHTVQTTDGYLLSLQRIPSKSGSNRAGESKDVVLLIHGLNGDATNWVLNYPSQSLGFLLHDAGYDVWLLNTRGCFYSKRHVEYTAKQYQFWNFSFEQVGDYDVPNTIDYILDATGEQGLFIVGHSQGTTATFAMLSDRPDYNDKVKLFVALAPVAKIEHMTSIIRVLVPFAEELLFIVDKFTAGEFLPANKLTRNILSKFCGVVATEACEEIIFALGGFDRKQLNETRLAVYTAHFPSTTSSKSLLHYAQLTKSGKFGKFDYGHYRNLEYYHQEEPPDFDVSRISAPVALFWSTNDKFSRPKDVEYLQENIQSLVFDYLVPYPYDHFDYIFAINAFEMIHKPILQLLPQY